MIMRKVIQEGRFESQVVSFLTIKMIWEEKITVQIGIAFVDRMGDMAKREDFKHMTSRLDNCSSCFLDLALVSDSRELMGIVKQLGGI